MKILTDFFTTGLLSIVIACMTAPALASSVDIQQEIRAYNAALLDADPAANVYRFNVSYVSTQKTCDNCPSIKVVGIPHYAVLTNNLYVSAFTVQTVNETLALTDEHVEAWIEEGFSRINAYHIIEMSPTSKRVFLSTDRFIESHYRFSGMKDDFLQEHRVLMERITQLSPRIADIATLIRSTKQTACYNATELPELLSTSPMVAFLAAIHTVVSEDNNAFLEQVHEAVLATVDCHSDEQWIDNVTERLGDSLKAYTESE
ncbi:hypothetical protein [Alteromonas macleodii]|uniref:Thioredoxin family protein n=1 Tax=Alteromonas macleodii TaxID=28108 RepID=A0AB36FKK5_ALTMA|nr:hypothetical protein [Alteromonas macleodii]OES24485.1 hypothetical protein BFV95_4752 [Alteromonas macleodii]OES25542.1 hypothetical protein BFV94_4395 [Alteromonas macleodii]OES38635.1 hypothetical protein BFV96_4746 [Alteromonas macleodii]